MGACHSTNLYKQSRAKNYKPKPKQNTKSYTKYVPFFATGQISTQNQQENQDQNNQMKWIEQVICHYREGDETPNTLKINKVADSHYANSFTAVGRVISVFNDDIVYNQKSFYYGTGSIINQRIVLTAAHVLRHGVLNVLANYVYFELQSAPNRPKKYIQVKRYGFHRNFIQVEKDEKDKQSQKHDIAVLILEQNDLITPQMTLGVQLNYKFAKQAHPETLVSGYPNHLNLGNQPFKQFWAQIKPSGTLHNNFLLYHNLLGGGFSGSPLMIKMQHKQKPRFIIFAVHKGLIGSKGYAVCLNFKTNKLNELLKHFSIKDTFNQQDIISSTLKVKEFEKIIQQEENKLFYQSEVLFFDDIRWSRQIRNKLQLKQFLQKLQEADTFKKGMQEVKFSIYHLLKQGNLQDRCFFRYPQWKYFFELFKNLYLNDEEQEKLLTLLLLMVSLNFQFIKPIIVYAELCQQIGQNLHYFWNSVHFKTRTWCKQHGENTQNNLCQKNQLIKFKICSLIEKGYQLQIDFKQRKRTRSEYLLWFYYYNKNLQRADKLAHAINRVQQQENPNVLYAKGQIMLQINDLQKAQEYFNRYLKFVQKNGIVEDLKSQANVLFSIGRIYQNQGNYEDALDFQNKSLQIYEKLNGRDSFACAETLNNIGGIYLNQGKYEDAIAFYKRSVQNYEKIKGKDSIECAKPLSNMGNIFFNQGKHEDALTLYLVSIEIYQKFKGKDSIDCANILNNIGIIYFKQGNNEEAIVFYKRSLQIKERVKGKDSIDCANTLNNMGNVYLNQEKNEEAFACYKRSLQIIERVKGKDSIDCADPLNNMGIIYFKQGNNEEAIVFYKRSLQIKERLKGKDYIDCANILNNMGTIYFKQGNNEEAFACYKRSLQIKESVEGKDSIDFAKLLNNMGVIQVKQGNYENAFIFYKKSLEIKERIKGKDSIDCADTLEKIGNIYLNQGKDEDAFSLYKRSLQIYEKVKGKDFIYCANILNNMGIIYFNQGQYKDALFFYKRSLEIKEKVKGKDSIDCADTLNNIGIIYYYQGNYEDAFSFYKSSLQIKERVKGKDSINCADTLENMGIIYFNQGKYVNALALYKRSIQIYVRVKGKDSINCANILDNMAIICFNLGKYEDASALQLRSFQIKGKLKGKN